MQKKLVKNNESLKPNFFTLSLRIRLREKGFIQANFLLKSRKHKGYAPRYIPLCCTKERDEREVA